LICLNDPVIATFKVGVVNILITGGGYIRCKIIYIRISYMPKYILVVFLITKACFGQVISISPGEQFQGQTVNVVIRLNPGVIQAANPPADSFDVYIKQGSTRINCDDFTPAQIFPGVQPYTDSLSASFSIPAGATPGWYTVHVTTYSVGLIPVDNILANSFVVRLPGSCSVPIGVDDSAVTTTSAKVFWSPAITADTFRVRYTELGTSNYFYKDVPGTGGIVSTSLNGLNPGATYLLDVSTICSGVHSTYSLPLDTILTIGQAVNCAIPYSITFTGITNTSGTITWNNNIVADTFRIKYKISNTSTIIYKNINGSLHSATLSNLQPGTPYDIQISSVCSGVGHGYSIVKTMTTLSTTASCVVPFGISSSALTNTSALISWSNLVDADTFRIRYSVNGGPNYFYKDVNGSSHSVSLTGLQPGTTYLYRISSICNGIGNGYSAFFSIATTGTASNCATIPFGLTSSNITNASATVTWTPLVTADSFLIRYSVNGTTNYKWKMVSGTAGNTATITGLSPITTYQWQVRTKCNAASPTAYSASDIFTTPLRLANNVEDVTDFRVYPNPSAGNFKVELSSVKSGLAKMYVTDLSGRIVYEKTIPVLTGINEIELSLSDLSAGIYNLSVENESVWKRERLIKE
jgi:hypothetical protein